MLRQTTLAATADTGSYRVHWQLQSALAATEHARRSVYAAEDAEFDIRHDAGLQTPNAGKFVDSALRRSYPDGSYPDVIFNAAENAQNAASPEAAGQ